MTERIYVCPLSSVNVQLNDTGATHLISLLNSEIMIETPNLIKSENHLKLTMSDIIEPEDGRITPERQHIEHLLEFVKNWDQTTPLLIHCLAGISRSAAATFITLCSVNSDLSEDLIAEALRKASPTAHPNRLLIKHADHLLGRNGRMIKAIENIGSPEFASEGIPFSVPANL